jgi:hypothetical protein
MISAHRIYSLENQSTWFGGASDLTLGGRTSRYICLYLEPVPKYRSVDFAQSAGVTVVPVGPRAPNLNAFAERFVLSIKSECLDHFVVFGEAHLRYLVQEYLAHYHTERPHQAKNNEPLTGDPSPPCQAPSAARAIDRAHRLGGLLNHYGLAA